MLHFTLVRTLEPTLLFFQIDHDSRAKDWCEALEEVIRFYYEDKHEVWNSRFPEQKHELSQRPMASDCLLKVA